MEGKRQVGEKQVRDKPGFWFHVKHARGGKAE